VLPAPPCPGVVQLVPVEVPKAMLPTASEPWEMAPQVSTIRTYWPLSAELTVPLVH
jgi:hypothetical protein